MTTLITSTVDFGGARPIRRSHENLNGDTDMDVVFRFNLREVDIACGQTSARLTASTTTGVPFDASDSIVTIGCRR